MTANAELGMKVTVDGLVPVHYLSMSDLCSYGPT